jgi:hypothetical protein
MDNAQREIRNEIETTRANMVSKIATLEDRVDSTIKGVKRSFDPKYQTEQHPWLALALSVAAGYLVGGLVRGRPAPRAQLVLPDNWNERAGRSERNQGMLASLTGMLSGVVTATAVSLAREYASGILFKRNHTERNNGHASDRETRGTERTAAYPR